MRVGPCVCPMIAEGQVRVGHRAWPTIAKILSVLAAVLALPGLLKQVET